MNTSVAIVILNYNGYLDTIECLESLLKINSNENINLIIVDNKSIDKSIDYLKTWLRNYDEKYLKIKKINEKKYINNPIYPYLSTIDNKVFLIESVFNGGFAYGNNLGIRFAKKYLNPIYLWLLNNDTKVAPDALNFLIEAYKDQPGIIGSKICCYDDETVIQGIGAKYNKYFGIIKTIGHNQDVNKYFPKYYFNLDFIIGASIFTSSKIIDIVGLMYEGYFLYYEEYDLALQAKRKGIKTFTATQSKVYHKVGATIGSSYNVNKRALFSDYWVIKNQFKFIKRNFWYLLPFCYMNTIIKIMLRLFRGNHYAAIQAIKLLINNNAIYQNKK